MERMVLNMRWLLIPLTLMLAACAQSGQPIVYGNGNATSGDASQTTNFDIIYNESGAPANTNQSPTASANAGAGNEGQ